MNFLKNIFGKNPKDQKSGKSEQSHTTESEQGSVAPSEPDKEPQTKQLSDLDNEEPIAETASFGLPLSHKRSIRVFISSTFRDMIEDRNALMTHCWPELRRFCRERHVELVEVDLRWGIAEEQSTRKETLKLCLDEIRACRPFFIGLLGERYGWIPGDDAFTADLKEEQPWLKEIHGKSVTELEILHGVLNNPEMAGRAFFYFRDPEYVKTVPDDKKSDFLSETQVDAEKQTELKDLIRKTCVAKNIPLKETYPDPESLAALVLEQLKDAIGTQFPIEDIPDPLTREARDHEAFAESRRRTYIGQPNYYKALDDHVKGKEIPFFLMGESGSGKSALLANWVALWRKNHPNDFIFQHYIGGTSDSSDHWKLMRRLIGEIKKWSDDPDELPHANDDMLRDFTVWLAKARIKAEREGVKFIVVLDALNQLEDKDHSHLLSWLPTEPFRDNLRLIVSTLPGEILDVLKTKGLQNLQIQPLSPVSCHRMISHYLGRFGKKLDKSRLRRLATTPAAANPLYLKILLDELRVTGTYDKLDERLGDYLDAKDIPTLLGKVLARYQRDYEHDRKGLVRDALGLIWAARRGLSESELLQLLRPTNFPQLPLATWAPLRSALEEGLLDRAGILNFAHDFLRTAVETAFLSDQDKKDDFRIQLADYFEELPPTSRSCDELPWLLWKTESFERLRNCLLNIDQFIEMMERDEEELRGYWVYLKEERNMGKPYLDSFNFWLAKKGANTILTAYAANKLGFFLNIAALYAEAEPLYQLSLQIYEDHFGKDHQNVARCLIHLGNLLQQTNCMGAAEPLLARALHIVENSFGKDHPDVAMCLSEYSLLLNKTNRMGEAEPLMRRALQIYENNFGENHPEVAIKLGNLAEILLANNHMDEAEALLKRAILIIENSFGKDHPRMAPNLSNLAFLLEKTDRRGEAEPIMRRAIKILEKSIGDNHPNMAISINNLALLLAHTNRKDEAEPMLRRALKIDENIFGKDHPSVARDLNNLASLLNNTKRIDEAETMARRAISILEKSFGKDHPDLAKSLHNLALILQSTNRLDEAEPLYRRAIEITEKSLGENHPDLASIVHFLAKLLQDTDRKIEAEQLYRRVIEIEEKSLGLNHPKVAISFHYLAISLQDNNHLSEAESFFRRALKIYETCNGENHPEVASCLNDLGKLLQATNCLGEAETLMRKALQIDESNFVQDHTKVARDIDKLAQLLQITNRKDEAEALYRRSIKIYETILGENHPDVATSITNLAIFLKENNCKGEAELLFRRVIEILEKSEGDNHAKLVANLTYLAFILVETKRKSEAETLLRRVIDILEKSLNENDPELATSLYNLSRLLQETNRNGQAEALLRRALQIDENSLGKDHPNVARDLNSFATLLQNTNRNSEAEAFLIRALQIDESTFGKDHPNSVGDINKLAKLYQATNRMDEAESLFGRALKIHKKNLGEDHPDVATSLNDLALFLQATNRMGEAEPKFKRALEIYINSFGNDHPYVAVTLNNLATLLKETKRIDEAEPLFRRVLQIEENNFGKDHSKVANALNNLGLLLNETNRMAEAEPLMRRALQIRENSLEENHHDVAISLNNLAQLLKDTNRMDEAEPLMRRSVEIQVAFTPAEGNIHLHSFIYNYTSLLQAMGWSEDRIAIQMRKIAPELNDGELLKGLYADKRNKALENYKKGEYPKAKALLEELLSKGFELLSTHIHLTRVCLLLSQTDNAVEHLELAWQKRAEASHYVIARMLWFKVSLMMIDFTSIEKYLGQLKMVLKHEDAIMEWTMEPVLEHLKPKITATQHALLNALVDALSYKGKVEQLNNFPEWRDAKPQEIE